jgi:prepilin-type N-terminal cleavage/methylation domain-containing protein
MRCRDLASWAPRPRGDAGLTLAEVIVAMSIMATAAAIGTIGIVQLYRGFNSVQAQTTAQQELTTSFERLDREIRYATAVSRPGTVGSDYYVEYLISTGGTPTCVELRLQPSAAQLQRRTWPNGSASSATAWIPVTSGVTPIIAAGGQVSAPFVLTPATALLNYESLQVSLTGTEGTANQQSIVTWAAMNADRTAADDVCLDGRPAT